DSSGKLANAHVCVLREGVPVVLQRLELPYYVSGRIDGNFYITTTEDLEQFPTCTPLFNRAWVTQELILSRRTIFFLKDGIVWSCKEMCENERGNHLAVTRPTVHNWEAFIRSYTLKDL